MPNQIMIRRDTSDNWTSVNPVIGSGELGYDTTFGALKVGDGKTAWSSLNWLSPAADVLTLGKLVVQSSFDLGSMYTSSTYIPRPGGGAISSGTAAGSTSQAHVFSIQASDYAIAGKTTLLTMRATLLTNGTKPATDITVSLYPVTSSSSSTNVAITVGAAVPSSDVYFVYPSFNAELFNISNSYSFPVPADGSYAFGITVSSNSASGSAVSGTISLTVNHA